MIDTERLKGDRAYWDAKAPESATHFDVSAKLFIKRNGKRDWLHYLNGQWLSFAPIKRSIPRPELRRAEWGGEGYAEVGQKVSYNNGQYFETSTVIGRHECWLWLDVPSVGLVTVQQVAGLIQPIRTKDQRKKGWVCGLAYRSLPDSEKASMEWQAHAQRIIESLYDNRYLKGPPDEQ